MFFNTLNLIVAVIINVAVIKTNYSRRRIIHDCDFTVGLRRQWSQIYRTVMSRRL